MAEARFADPGITGERHDLAMAPLDLREALGEDADLAGAPDELGEAALDRRGEAGAAGGGGAPPPTPAPPPPPGRPPPPPPRAAWVASLTTTLPGRAPCCRRAARFVVSPTAV